MSSPSLLQLSLLLPAIFTAAIFDIRERRIPNCIVAFIAASGIAACVLEGGAARAAIGGISASTALLACAPLYLLRGLAAGDVKLIAASALWWTLSELIVALVAIALSGAVLAVTYAIAVRGVTEIPYGVAIATGTVAATFFA